MKFRLNFNKLFKTTTEDGNNLFQYLCTLTGALSIINTSMHNAWPTPSLPQLLGGYTQITVSDSEGSWMSVIIYLGCPMGSVLAFLTVDILGRKKVILLTAIPFIAAWLAIAYASVVEVIYVARFLAGMAEGATFTAMPMYLGEIADPKIRGFLGSSTAISFMTGIILMDAIAIFFNIRTTSLISISVSVLFLGTFTWMPESPYFLIMSRQTESAKKSLILLTGRSNVDNDMCRLSKAVQSRASRKACIVDLFKIKSNRMGFLIIIGLRTFQQLTGFNAITLYAQILFENIETTLPSNVMTIIYFSVQFVATIIASVSVDKLGRKPLVITSIVGCGVFLILQGTYYLIDETVDLSHFNVVPILALMLFVMFYNLGMNTIYYLMLGELFPTTVKAFALCTAEIYYAFIATVVSKFFQIVKDEVALFIPFYVFASCCVFGLFFIVRYLPETKGKTLEEIQDYLSGRNSEELSEVNRENT